jgi:hypothetical protein
VIQAAASSTTRRSVAAAALCIAVYGIAVCLGQLTLAGPGGSMPLPLIRMGVILALASCALAFALWQRARWAWLAAVPFAAWFTYAGIVSAVQYLKGSEMHVALAPLGVAFFGVGVASISAALVLLLLPGTRAAFHHPAA